MANFIRTFDEETAAKLRAAGFNEIANSGRGWLFLNNAKINFADSAKCVYSNKLEF